MRIYEIYSQESFVESILPYFSFQMAQNKQKQRIIKELNTIDPDRVVFSPVENLI